MELIIHLALCASPTTWPQRHHDRSVLQIWQFDAVVDGGVVVICFSGDSIYFSNSLMNALDPLTIRCHWLLLTIGIRYAD